ncbi:hypothetical protein DM860_007594 [Cuscuta australis]|uniref:Core-2/I-branching beta-1,6-N-acetylglucosaminyltransferase family protein n=1 Tax=Cuscuta australis TaxID=267555 RepID=A0A328E5V4_9ASTE|nr:hypothetical protein DM860_007594 [Cuscuta australis]
MFPSPSPLSLLCALLLCFPLAFFYTINTPLPAASTTGNNPLPGTGNQAAEGNDRGSVFLRSSPPVGRRQPLSRLSGRVGFEPGAAGKRRKLAFMFLTTTPLPFAPLWELFFRDAPAGAYNVYVHADPSYNYTTPFGGVFAGRVIPSMPTRRNTASLAAAARRLLAHALRHDRGNRMFALLSPHCIPLHSFNFTYAAVIDSGRSFIEVLANEPWALPRWLARGDTAMLPEVKFEDFRIGSQFFILTRKHARVVVRDRKLWRKFRAPCLEAETCYPEEQYFPTLLHMVDPQGVATATLTHVDWSRSSGGHPRTYNATEVGPGLIRALRDDRPRYGDEEINNGSNMTAFKRRDPFIFARKFSPDTLGSLMSIAEGCILKD